MSESKYFPAIPAATNALSSFPQVFSCVSPWRANQKLIFWVNCTGLFLIMNFNKNCGTHERIKILPGHSSCQQCTFVVPAGFFLCFSLKTKSKTDFLGELHRIISYLEFHSRTVEPWANQILPGNRSKYFATDISGGSGILVLFCKRNLLSRCLLQTKLAVKLFFHWFVQDVQ